jgi:hypothetical protein
MSIKSCIGRTKQSVLAFGSFLEGKRGRFAYSTYPQTSQLALDFEVKLSEIATPMQCGQSIEGSGCHHRVDKFSLAQGYSSTHAVHFLRTKLRGRDVAACAPRGGERLLR